ncbi:MAG: phosphoribosylamine--glycine ligase [Kiritimatiellae bacterium]|nr:phosphoribosylamine--glycine ligase [Kiritimatiellia bacterium]
MRVLVIGSGGREHALAWKLAQDSARPELFCAPGNAGTAEVATNLAIAATDIEGLIGWAARERPDLTVVGPEAPLCAGLVDQFAARDLKAFGPAQPAARLEGSKVFAKEVMQAAGVPTGRAEAFTDSAAACAYARRCGAPLVIKADGLAAGKGVTVCGTVEEAETAIHDAVDHKVFGTAGEKVLVEECLQGEEASILALVDGERVVMLASSQDHKRAFDNDQGPNTGGMGAYSPAPVVSESLWPVIREEIFGRTLRELKKRGMVYRGVLYAGLMMTADGPRVLEFNCRFGDPETQAILPRWEGDILPALVACAEGRLEERHVRWRSEACVCVVMAAGGYPGAYGKGHAVEGLAEAGALPGVVVFHAGTAADSGRVVTAGGRVLGVTALGADLRAAADRAYEAAGRIRFEGVHYRRDIAARALKGRT